MNRRSVIEVSESTQTTGPCTLLAECTVERGGRQDWEELAGYHYRGHRYPAGVRAVYRARVDHVVGVLVYTVAPLQSSIRNTVLRGMYQPGTNAMKPYMTAKVNAEIELICRLVIHPTFRGIGLAQRMLAETLPQRPVRFVECSAAMGRVNPCFARSGMEAYEMPPNQMTMRVLAALSSVGIPREIIGHGRRLREAIAALPDASREFVTAELLRYERPWIKGRTNRRVKLDIEHAAARVSMNALMQPMYYLWRNPRWRAA